MFAIAAINRGRERLTECQMVKVYQKRSEAHKSVHGVTGTTAGNEESTRCSTVSPVYPAHLFLERKST